MHMHSVLNVKALVGAFNQEKALVWAFSVIVKTNCITDGALHLYKLQGCYITWAGEIQPPRAAAACWNMNSYFLQSGSCAAAGGATYCAE